MRLKYTSKILSWLFLVHALVVLIVLRIFMFSSTHYQPNWFDPETGISQDSGLNDSRDIFLFFIFFLPLIVFYTTDFLYTVLFNGWFLKKNKNSFCQSFIFQKYNESLSLDEYQFNHKTKNYDTALTIFISVVNVIFFFGYLIAVAIKQDWIWTLTYFLVGLYVPSYFLGTNIYRLVKMYTTSSLDTRKS